MGDSQSWKPGSKPGGPAQSAKSPAARDRPDIAPEEPGEPAHDLAGKSGRVIHDERGNAVWDWIKETSRVAIDSTSRLLKRLEVPELKVEDTQPNQELSLESERDAGGGYNPYGGSTPGKSGGPGGRAGPGGSGSPGGVFGGGSRGARDGGTAGTRSSGNTGGSNSGGGYDPYGKGVTRKPGRKP